MESSRPRKHRQGVVSTLVAVLAPCFIATSSWAAGPRVNFNIPAGEARTTLQAFILQANLQGLYEIDTIRGITTKEVRGSFEADEALRMMLDGAPLQFGIE